MALSSLTAEKKAEFGHRLQQALKPLGVAYFAYFVKDKSTSNLPLVISNYPDEWVEHYIRDQLYRFDPVINYGLRRVAPYAWSEALDHGIGPEKDSVFRQSRTFDIVSGYSLPLHDPSNQFAALSVCNRDQDPDFGRTVTSAMNRLMMLFLTSHDRLTTLLPVKGCEEPCAHFEGNKIWFHLTRRETDVLRWASQGKTYPEIAIILGISVRTVKFHIENIVKKLDVSNAKHAIYKAQHCGLI